MAGVQLDSETLGVYFRDRFCIKPTHQKRNLASWLISRSYLAGKAFIHTIIAYSDLTFNHHGTIYKALNFELDSVVNPDYWYVGKDGLRLHKKTLYNRARKMKLTEREYADMHALKKIKGLAKLKYIFHKK